jgi:hypothetical protein
MYDTKKKVQSTTGGSTFDQDFLTIYGKTGNFILYGQTGSVRRALTAALMLKRE